jgi:hypothetical protein
MSNLVANDCTFNSVGGDQINTVQNHYTVNVHLECCTFVFPFSPAATMGRETLVKICDAVGWSIHRYAPLHQMKLIS